MYKTAIWLQICIFAGKSESLFMEHEVIIGVKNMVCDRCIWVVREILHTVQVPFVRVELGRIVLNDELSASQHKALSQHLQQHGFSLLNNPKEQLVEKIRCAVIRFVCSDEDMPHSLSAYITSVIPMDFSALSRTFAEYTSVTLEQYYIQLRIERVKELLSYGELTLAEIADRVHYSSQAHLCAQFKKVTGMTPTQYRRQANPSRRSLDSVI